MIKGDNPYRKLPAVNDVLAAAALSGPLGRHAREQVVAAVREELALLRQNVGQGGETDGEAAAEAVAARAAVYGALAPAPADKQQARQAADFVADLCKYPGSPSVIAEARRHLLEAHAERLTAERVGAGLAPAQATVTAEDIEAGRAPQSVAKVRSEVHRAHAALRVAARS